EMGEGGGTNRAVYFRPTDGSPATLIGEGEGNSLSHDGRWAISRAVRAKGALTVLPTGVGTPRKLEPEGLRGELRGRFFPDGRRLVIDESLPGEATRVFTVPIEGGKPIPLGRPGFTLPDFGSPVSPDGRSVALLDPEGKAVVCPVDGGPAAPLPGIEPGEIPMQWTADGRFLYACRGGSLPAKIFKIELETGRRELVREIVLSDAAGVASLERVQITPDGSFVAYAYRRNLASLSVVSGLK
ncbi:MAG: hypothetical protein ABIT01_14465, partial [Thermoanaerobaculia bacterium]